MEVAVFSGINAPHPDPQKSFSNRQEPASPVFQIFSLTGDCNAPLRLEGEMFFNFQNYGRLVRLCSVRQ
jgi:hypothetical protein